MRIISLELEGDGDEIGRQKRNGMALPFGEQRKKFTGVIEA